MILFKCDSRGKDLYQFVAAHTTERIHVCVHSGAKLYQSATRSRDDIKRYQPQQIYILSGIINSTTMNRRTR